MRQVAALMAVVLVATSCSSSTYKIPGKELGRLAAQPPETRGQRVRVQQELADKNFGPAEPVTAETQIVLFPQVHVYGHPQRRREYRSGWGSGSLPSSGPNLRLGGGGGGGGDKGAAIAILVLAAMVLFVVVAVEGSRFDGFAELHPMHPVYLEGKDGGKAVLPLAWIDAETAAWAKHGYVRRSEGPWLELERAPLDREGWNMSMYGGVATYRAIDGGKGAGPASTIQLGYFPIHEVGFVGSLFLGWRELPTTETLTAFRASFEVQAYPISTGKLQIGGYLGYGGSAFSEQMVVDGDVVSHRSEGSKMYTGGGILQLDINTRIALTARFGLTNAHGARTSDAVFGLSVY